MLWILVVAYTGSASTMPAGFDIPEHRFADRTACMSAAYVVVRNIDSVRGYIKPDHPDPTGMPQWPNSASGKYAIATCMPAQVR